MYYSKETLQKLLPHVGKEFYLIVHEHWHDDNLVEGGLMVKLHSVDLEAGRAYWELDTEEAQEYSEEVIDELLQDYPLSYFE